MDGTGACTPRQGRQRRGQGQLAGSFPAAAARDQPTGASHGRSRLGTGSTDADAGTPKRGRARAGDRGIARRRRRAMAIDLFVPGEPARLSFSKSLPRAAIRGSPIHPYSIPVCFTRQSAQVAARSSFPGPPVSRNHTYYDANHPSATLLVIEEPSRSIAWIKSGS